MVELTDRWAKGEEVLAKGLGLYTIRFARLEETLNQAIGQLLGTDTKRNKIMIAAIRNVSTRIDIFSALVEEIDMPDAGREKLRAASDELARLNSYRNNLVHNPWTAHMYREDALFMAQKAWVETSRKKSRIRFQDFSPEEIAANVDACLACSKLVSEGLEVYQAALNASAG